MIISVLLCGRDVLLRYQAVAKTLSSIANELTTEIDKWRYTVQLEAPPPFMAQYQPPRTYAPTEAQDPISRPSSPISTVAGWTTISGTMTFTQYSEAPPPYRVRRNSR